jgi:hypothetical protein
VLACLLNWSKHTLAHFRSKEIALSRFSVSRVSVFCTRVSLITTVSRCNYPPILQVQQLTIQEIRWLAKECTTVYVAAVTLELTPGPSQCCNSYKEEKGLTVDMSALAWAGFSENLSMVSFTLPFVYPKGDCCSY